MIDLHFVPTPNGLKISIALAELGLEHRIIPYDLMKGEHLTPAYRTINPNGRLPAIVDHDPVGGGEPLPIFESGAILLYLAEKTGRLIPDLPRRRAQAQQWLMWQMSGLGPMHGQAHHFIRYAPEGQDYAVKRYTNEAERLLAVLDGRLAEAEYLAEEYSIADIAVWPWIFATRVISISLDPFPHVRRWYQAVAERPAVASSMVATNDPRAQRAGATRANLTTEEWSNLFGDNMLKAPRR
jgi:GSH-dependent disulfide-bond oxidoreductase